ncbi:MAG: acetate/propionate family kinase [Candidatus Paceibacterota bacterium]|jgi:acetate kinase
MGKNILISNIGSASKKYALYSGEDCLLSAHFERWDDNRLLVQFSHKQKKEQRHVSETEYKEALAYTLRFLIEEEILSGEDMISAIGLRVVAPGEYFTSHRIIDKEYLKKLEEMKEIVPLHIYRTLLELKEIRQIFPNTPTVGISDSAYHKTMPEVAKRYALSKKISSEYGIYRYGYHGLSFASVVSKFKTKPGGMPENIIICHLGSGASVAAIKNGKSADTSMGFTPLEGVPMGSRVGSIDAGAVLYLEKVAKLSPDKLFHYLNTETGLYGLSGGVLDIRELLYLKEKGNEGAILALDMFTYRIKQYIGAYAAILGGVDAIVFTGTAGERAPKIREQVCEGLKEFGIVLDPRKNDTYTGGKDGHIQSVSSKVGIIVFQADEMKIMASEAELCIKHARTTS